MVWACNFDEYLEALAESLHNIYLSNKFPEYARILAHDYRANREIIIRFLESGLDSQQGLECVVRCILHNPLFAKHYDYIDCLLRPFVEFGGASMRPLTGRLVWGGSYSGGAVLEHEFEVRAGIIDAFWDDLETATISYINWSAIPAAHYLTVEKPSIPNIYYQYLKYCCPRLATKNADTIIENACSS
jgi:hypothetical protein